MIVQANTSVAYVWTGQVSHVLDNLAEVIPELGRERQPSLCNFRPIWPGVWLFDGALEMPLCRNCVAKEAVLRVGT